LTTGCRDAKFDEAWQEDFEWRGSRSTHPDGIRGIPRSALTLYRDYFIANCRWARVQSHWESLDVTFTPVQWWDFGFPMPLSSLRLKNIQLFQNEIESLIEKLSNRQNANCSRGIRLTESELTFDWSTSCVASLFQSSSFNFSSRVSARFRRVS
jgi:hypothetical protein